MEIKYEETQEYYYIEEEDKPLVDPTGETMRWDLLEEAEKYRQNLDMVRLIYGDQ